MREMHLFAGAGGGILGGMLLGHTPVCAVEIEPFCQAVLETAQLDGLLPRFPIYSDIKEFDGTPWRGKVDVVAGGFPCQDISSAGKGKGIHGEKSSLFFELARVVREVGPQYVFLENSPMLVGRGLDTVLGTLADMGYDAAWGVISAADCGANHLRKRVWILADASCGRGSSNELCTRRDVAWVCGKDVAHATNNGTGWRPEQQECGKEAGHVANSEGVRIQGLRPGRIKESFAHGQKGLPLRQDERSEPAVIDAQPRLGRVVDGLALGLDCNHLEFADWWEVEPEIPRVCPSQPARVYRLKALGNGQVPRVAATAWVVLEKILRGECQ